MGQLSFLPLLDERKGENLHGRIERERMEFCDVAWKKANGDLVAYVRECVANTSIMYDERDDVRLQDDDVIDHCFVCGRPITAGDMRRVDAISYSWKCKDGTIVSPRCCWGNENCNAEKGDNPFGCEDAGFHDHYLRITGFTDEEYIQDLKQNQPSVFAARVKAGMYTEEGRRLPPPAKNKSNKEIT